MIDLVKDYYQKNLRKCQVYKNGHWQDIQFQNLQKGDKFRLFEPTGELVIGNENKTEFKALNNAYINEDGIYCVDIE